MKFTPFTKEQIEAGYRLAEELVADAFKDLPCPCPNCPGHTNEGES